jgi:adenylosuccinate synthase
MLSGAVGSRSPEWNLQAINWLTNAARGRGQAPGPNMEAQTNAALAFMSDIAPENTVEAAQGLQMFATHALAMSMLERAKQTDDRQALNEFVNMATKLTRTFTAQAEALAKVRRGGEQVVKYVHVHEGGQAVVAGTINQGGRQFGTSEQPHGTGAGKSAECSSLPSPDAARDGVPLAVDAERAVPLPRRPLDGRA